MGMTLHSQGAQCYQRVPRRGRGEGQRQRDRRCCSAGCEDGGRGREKLEKQGASGGPSRAHAGI